MFRPLLKISFSLFLFSTFFTCSRHTVYAADTPLTFNLWQDIPYSFVEPAIETTQDLLMKEGYLDIPAATGYFGGLTKAAVAEYQTAHDLAVTGVVGSITRRTINKEVADGRQLPPDPLTEVSGSFSPVKTDEGETEQLLDVPLIEQIYPLSCETASLQMALQYKDVTKSQDDLIDLIGTSQPLYKYINTDGSIAGAATGTTIWGDPDQGFVGNIRGWLYTMSDGLEGAIGWGVNMGPVARVAQMFRPDSSAEASGGIVADIVSEISAGNPVIVWQYSQIPSDLINLDSFTTPAGKAVRFVPTHVKVVVGFKKESDGTYIMLINDPEYGRLEVPQDEFEKASAGYYDDMVVVR